MSQQERSIGLPRCPFCRMRTQIRFLGLPLCAICKDQVQDFLWVSLVQSCLVVFGGMSRLFFVVDELLLFAVLVLAKHRLNPWIGRVLARR
jgi:hypothetical protein